MFDMFVWLITRPIMLILIVYGGIHDAWAQYRREKG